MHSRQDAAPSRWVAVGVAAVGAFLLFFFRLGGTPLLDPDEPVYGQIAREMVRSGNWLTPHLAGRPWFDKPPLFYWASAAAMVGLGPTELAARLPSALAAVLLAALVFGLGRHLFGRRAGWIAAAVLATAAQTIILGRAAVTDMLFALTLMAALGAFGLWYEGIGRSKGWAALCGGALGLALLCKGPVAIVLLGAAVLLFLLWERKLGRLLSIDLLVALLCCLLVAGPWYAAMLALNREAFLGQFIDQNNLQRFSRPEHKQGASPLYFLPVLLIGLFPWSAFLPGAMSAGRRQSAGRLLLVWIAVVFLFFSASSTKLVTYIYPLYPAVALLIGACLGNREKGAGNQERVGRRPGLSAGTWPLFPVTCATTILGVLFAVGLVVVAKRQYPAALMAAGVLGVVLLAGTIGGMVMARRGGTPLPAYGMMMVGVASVLAGLIVPRVATAVSLRELAIWENTTHRPLVAYRLRTPGFLFYAGRELPYEEEPLALAQRARSVPGLAVAMSRRALPGLASATPGLEWRVIWQRGSRVVAEPVRLGVRQAEPDGRVQPPVETSRRDGPHRWADEQAQPGRFLPSTAASAA